MGSTRITIITALRTRCSVLPPGPSEFGSGAEHGSLLELGPGDVLIIPAGVAHKNEGASPDLIVVGAYPGGRSPDVRRPTAQEREKTLRNIAQVTLPVCDPVYGPSGPLLDRWRAADRT